LSPLKDLELEILLFNKGGTAGIVSSLTISFGMGLGFFLFYFIIRD